MSRTLATIADVRIVGVTDADLDRQRGKAEGRRCALCDWTQRQARYLVEGPTGAVICDRCALAAAEIITKALGGGLG